MSVRAAVTYALASLEEPGSAVLPIPQALLSQARLAARTDVPLDAVLRRYFAGFTLISDFTFSEAREAGMPTAALQVIMRDQAVRFDRLVEAVAADYVDEQGRTRREGSERKLAARLQGLLDGELMDLGGIDYGFEEHHLGTVCVGQDAEVAVRDLASQLNRRLLLVRPDAEVAWAWLGGKEELEPAELEQTVAGVSPDPCTLAMGEPAEGLSGWRLTHRQAKAALPICLRRQEVVRYAEVALLSALMQDELLAASLKEIYLKPLERSRDGGESARRTLRAYFAAGRNVSSAAAALGISRRTVANRLRLIEEKLSRPLTAMMGEMEAVLQLDELESEASAGPHGGSGL